MAIIANKIVFVCVIFLLLKVWLLWCSHAVGRGVGLTRVRDLPWEYNTERKEQGIGLYLLSVIIMMAHST